MDKMASGIEQCSFAAKKRPEADRKLGLTGKVKLPSLLECNFNRRLTSRSVHYFTTGTGVDRCTMRDVNAEPTPFWSPPDTDEVTYRMLHKVCRKLCREEEARYDVITRPNYRSRQKTSDKTEGEQEKIRGRSEGNFEDEIGSRIPAG